MELMKLSISPEWTNEEKLRIAIKVAERIYTISNGQPRGGEIHALAELIWNLGYNEKFLNANRVNYSEFVD